MDGFDEWKKTGIAYIPNSRTNQQMPLYFQFYEDFDRNRERLLIKKAAKKLNNIYETLNVRYSGIIDKEGNKKYSEYIIDKLAYANYKIDNKNSIRFGYGIFYDKINYALYSDALQQNNPLQLLTLNFHGFQIDYISYNHFHLIFQL